LKVLHFCVFKKFNLGIKTQLLAESKAAESILPDNSWHVTAFSEDIPESDIMYQPRLLRKGPFRKLVNYISLRVYAYLWLLRNQKKYDFILIRYSPGDIFLFFTCLLMKTPYMTVHHTIEMDEIRLGNRLVNKIQVLFERLFGRIIRKKAAAIIGVTQEICDAQLEVIPYRKDIDVYVYPNGIGYQSNVITDQRGRVPELLFVASYFAPWQGLDRLIRAAKSSEGVLIVHVVGELNASDKAALETDSRFIVHGRKSQNEIIEIAQKCCLGLSSFALDRKGMTQAATLKVREYLMLGLPVYSGHEDVFPQTFSYYRKGEANIDDILDYVAEIEHAPRATVALLASDYIDKSKLLGELYAWINTHFD